MGTDESQIPNEMDFEVYSTSALDDRRPVTTTLQSLRGVVPAIPGRASTDVEDQIEEAMEEEAARVVSGMQ